ncbi:MAG TPA: hypothetical protein VFM58_09990, partial [Solirubrobacteraceae bacterium]|nr:hypothetical protein [Solirubrobacteraceae bacterium]
MSAPADEQATQVLPGTGEQPAAQRDQPAASASDQAAGPVEPPTVVGDQAAGPVEPPTVVGEQPAGPVDQPTVAGDQPAQPVDQPTVVGDQPTEAIPSAAPVRDLPAGIDPNELADAPTASARRGKLRRRLRYLRAVRDLLLRDLGGFTYEIQRSAGGDTQDAHRRLIDAKTNRIAALDTEVRDLEGRLGEPHGGALLREPGIGGTCPECGELHASDAHYCARCGAPLDAKARARRDAAVAAAAQPTTSSHATPEPAPASVLWAAGPRPEHTPEPDDEEDTHPSRATSQWFALRPHAPSADDEVPAAKGDAPAATTDEPAAKGDAPAAKADSPAAKGDTPAAKGDAPAAKSDEPAAKGDAPAAK